MKGYSFRSLTDLVLKIFKTKVNAGTGLSGGGSLEADRTLTVKYGTAAGTATQGNDSRVVNAASNATVNAKEAALEAKKADKVITITAGTGLSGGGTLAANRSFSVNYGTAAGTSAQGNDSRLSNSREWTAETISQAEAEAGTATTRRAFTAQRVRQAIVAWWNGITGIFGRDLITSSNNTVARSKLGLGTAATKDVGTAGGDIVSVGDFGLKNAIRSEDLTKYNESGFFLATQRTITPPDIMSDGGWAINLNWHLFGVGNRYNAAIMGNVQNDVLKYQRISRNGALSSVHISHSGNLLKTTGQSTQFPMTQKAVTDALETRSLSLRQNIKITVGAGGDFTTINAAVLYLSRFTPDLGVTAEVELRKGFVMREQLLVEGLELGWITITGVDSETIIDEPSLTRVLRGDEKPAFGVVNGTLPTIGQLFRFSIKGKPTNQRSGIVAHAGKATILSASGVKNAGQYGIMAHGISLIQANGVVASGAGDTGIYAANSSSINTVGSDTSDAGQYGIYASGSSIISAQGATISGAGNTGIYAQGGSTIDAEGSIVKNAGQDGIAAYQGSKINAVGSNTSGAGNFGIRVQAGSIISANNATGTKSQAVNTVSNKGIIFG